MNKDEILDAIKSIDLKHCSKDDLSKIILLYEFLEKKSIIDKILENINKVEIEEELLIRITSIDESIKSRKFKEKHSIDNATFYYYTNKLKVYTKPAKKIEEIFWVKLDKELGVRLGEIYVVNDKNKSELVERENLKERIESSKDKSITIIVNN